jgi:endonuclease YncB( thermonuclease family)
MRTFLAVCVLILLMAGDSFAGRVVAGVVRAVYDGDTVLLATREDSRLKVRLYGIDAPETAKPGEPGQPFGAVAKRTLMYKIMGRQVSAEIVDIDQYRRAVAVLRYGGRDINREMVVEGMAWAYRQYLHGAYASEYIDAEERARARHRGLWRDNNPMPPWEFRQALKRGGRGHGRNRR